MPSRGVRVSDDRETNEPVRFVAWLESIAPRLRRALIGYLGHERGQEAFSEAMAFAWQNQDQVMGLDQPVGYLVRVGTSRTRSRRLTRAPEELAANNTVAAEPIDIDPGLDAALMRLTARQRAAVVLVNGLGWTYDEAANALGISRGSVQRHVERGLRHLRVELGDVEP